MCFFSTIYIGQVMKKMWIKLFREKILKKHLSSVEYTFTEPNIEDIYAVPYFPLDTLSSARRRLAWVGCEPTVDIHICFLWTYENIPCCIIVQFSGLIFEITFWITFKIFKLEINFS